MSDQVDPTPKTDLLDRALALLDEVEQAADDEALEPLDVLRKRAIAAAEKHRDHES